MTTKRRPILFQTFMVVALIRGEKTETRRPHVLDPEKRYGTPGDELWVRETHRFFGPDLKPAKNHSSAMYVGFRAGRDVLRLTPDSKGTIIPPVLEPDDLVGWANEGNWRPTIHMPEKVGRLFLTVRELRTEHLLKIDDAGARREGFEDRAHFIDAWDEMYKKPRVNKKTKVKTWLTSKHDPLVDVVSLAVVECYSSIRTVTR